MKKGRKKRRKAREVNNGLGTVRKSIRGGMGIRCMGKRTSEGCLLIK